MITDEKSDAAEINCLKHTGEYRGKFLMTMHLKSAGVLGGYEGQFGYMGNTTYSLKNTYS